MNKSQGLRVDIWVSGKHLDSDMRINLTELVETSALIVVTVPEFWPVDGIQELVSRRVCDALGVDWDCGSPLPLEESK
jgi:hypothetical protein